jgi:RNA polymerase sigma factor (sigma-70 family)
MTEEILYTSLLKGAIIGDLPYANYTAYGYAKQIKNGQLLVQNIPTIYNKLILIYGNLLEKEEENDLEVLLQSPEKQRIIDYLLYLEEIYNPYFLRLISNRCHEVQLVYDNIASRIKSWHFEDKEIKDLKTAESNGDFDLAGNVYKKMEANNNLAIIELHKKTENPVYHYVISRNGTKDDSNTTWSVAFSAFSKRLKIIPYKPIIVGFYEWRPVDTDKHQKATIFTYFIEICHHKWIDEIRRRTRIDGRELKGLSDYDQSLGGCIDEINDFYELEDLKFRLKRAIEKLGGTCKKIINSKYFGGKFGDGQTSKETAKEIDRTVGTIDNKHPKCLEELRTLMTLQIQ